jgi:peptidyl-dipeptidase Dcp
MITFVSPYQAVAFDKISNSHFRNAFSNILDETRKKIEKIISDTSVPDFNNTIEAIEYSLADLKRFELIFFNINAAETNKELQQLAQEISPQLSSFYNDITLNEELFNKVKRVYNKRDDLTLSAEARTLLEETYQAFVRNGASLDGKAKQVFREITRELSLLSLKFEENLLDETNDFILHLTSEEDLAGLPDYVVEAASIEAGARNLPGWVFTLKMPSYTAFMKYADNRGLRERLYRAYNSRGFHNNERDNQKLIKRIVNLRLKKANLLGYDTYARYVLEKRMAETPERVSTFLNELLNASMPFALKEYAELQGFARNMGADFVLQRWDWPYYAEKLKKEKFNINDELTKPYFRLEKVEKSIFSLINRLYGLRFVLKSELPVYHPDVRAYEVFDEAGKFIAILYLDYFPREGKQGGAWMTNYLEQYKKDSQDVRPHVSLVFNFTKPTGTKPSLLTYDELRTFLHEFGHALHSMLSECTYRSLSGTNVYRDFVELPSQIMENWGEEKEWLREVAVHYETGERMPDAVIEKLIQSRNFHNGYAFVRQLSFGFNDMAWHTITEPYEGSVIEFERQAVKPAEYFPLVDGCCVSTGFHHIFGGGYAAGYYGYKWAEVLDADAFALFKQQGIFDRKTAMFFREHILSRGGTEHPMELYKRFRGREPSINALMERSGLIAQLPPK